MRNKYLKKITICFLILMLLCPLSSKAAYNSETVFDYADLLTESEEDTFRKYSEKFEKYDVSVIFLTTNDTEGKSSKVYSDNFYDNNHFRPDGVLFMIDMDNREIYINTVGKYIDILTELDISQALDSSYIHATHGDYALCFTKMSKSIGSEIENYENPILGAMRFSLPTLLIMIFVTIIVIIVLISKHNRANKKTAGEHYVGSDFRVNNRNVVYMGCRPEVIPGYYDSQNKGGGGSGGSYGSGRHISSGGVSHGGGGRKF